MKKTKKVLLVCMAAAFTLAMSLSVCGCSKGYTLDKDDSILTEWGTRVQYKIDSSWDTLGPSDSSFSSSADYYTKDLYLHISLEDTEDSLYEYSSKSTYADWVDSEEEFLSQTPEEQAEQLGGDPEYPDLSDPDNYPQYSNASINEVGTITADGNEFRVYKVSYTATYSDSYYLEAHEKNPDFEQVQDTEMYYALLKDGDHDVEIIATSEGLLNDFMKTLEISW